MILLQTSCCLEGVPAPGFVQGTRPLPPPARKAGERCQLLPPWLTPALLRTAPFQPALVFVGLSHETCSSIKCQKTILFQNWLNSLPFKHVKLAHHGDLKMPKPAKGKEEVKKSSLCLSALNRQSCSQRHMDSNPSTEPQFGALGSRAWVREGGKAALSLLGRSPDFACKSWHGSLCNRQQNSLDGSQEEALRSFVSSPAILGAQELCSMPQMCSAGCWVSPLSLK